MDAYPDWKELARDGIPLTACQFPSCPVECKNFKQLLDHIKKRHLDSPCQIMHHWVHEMALHERNPQGLGQGERGHVELVWSSGGQVDEDQVCGFEKPVREGAGQVGRPPNLFRQKGGSRANIYWDDGRAKAPHCQGGLLACVFGLPTRAPPRGQCAPDATRPIGIRQVACKVCRKKIRKSGILGHMSKLHGVDSEVIKTWLSHKDGTLLSNTKRRVRRAGDPDEVARLEGHCRSHLLFTRAIFAIEYRREGQPRDGCVGESGDGAESQLRPDDPPDTIRPRECAADGVPHDLAAAPKAELAGPGPADIGRLSKLLEELPATISRGFREANRGAGAVCEVPEPRVAICPKARAWVYAGNNGLRRGWPLRPKQMDLSEFHAYLTETVGLASEKTAGAHVRQVGYFFSLFDSPDDADPIGFLVALCNTKIISQAVKLPIMHPDRPMTYYVLISTMHFVDFAKLKCNLMDWHCALRIIEKLRAIFLEPLKAGAQNASSARPRFTPMISDPMPWLPLAALGPFGTKAGLGNPPFPRECWGRF